MKTRNRVLPVIIAIMMAIPLLMVLPIEVSAAGKPVVLNSSNFDTKLNWIEPTANALVGNYEIDQTEDAISLNYHNSTATNADWGSRVKFPLQMKNAQHDLTDQYYMVVTYKTNLTSGSLRIGNFGTKPENSKPDTFLELASNVGVSGGEYVYTAPINTSTGNTNFFNRLTQSNLLKEMLFFVYNPTEDEYSEKYFYIKEIAFFSSLEEAYEMYPPVPEVLIDLSSKESAEEFLAVPADSGKNDVNGVFSFDTEEGTLSLTYSTLPGKHAGLGSYVKYNMDMKNSSVIGDDDKYIVATHKTNMSASSLALNNLQSAGANIPEEPEVEPEIVYGDADGDGQTTEADLANLGRALAKWKGYALPDDASVLDLNSDGKVNPLDLVYLARHIAGWDDYKNLPLAEKVYLPVTQYPESILINFESEELFETNSMFYKNPENEAECGLYRFTNDALKLDECAPVKPWQGKYRAMLQLETVKLIEETHTLIQVTYKTDAKSGAIRLYDNETGRYTVLASDVSVSDGQWVTSPLVELSAGAIEALIKAKPMTVSLNTNETNVNVEIKSIGIYCSPEQAKIAAGQTDPVIFKFGTASEVQQTGAKFYKNGKTDDGEDLHAYVTENGVAASKLNYVEHSWGNYRIVFGTDSQGKADHFKESNKWYVRVKYKTNASVYSTMTLINNQNGNSITLESDFTSKQDEWRISMPVQLPSDFVDRLRSNLWVTLGYHFLDKNVKVYVSEVAFFPNFAEACSYYGDIDPTDVSVISTRAISMRMGDSQNVKLLDSDANSDLTGYWERGEDSASVVVRYTEYNMYGWGNYRFMAAFSTVPAGMNEAKYLRVVYKATNPTNQTEPVALKLMSNGITSVLTVEDDVKNTGGQWVLSPVQQISPAILSRLTNRIHCTVGFFSDNPGGEYEVRDIKFFYTIEEAMAYKLETGYKPLSIADNSIDKYTIVMPKDASKRTKMAVDDLKNHIKTVAGVTLEVITDEEPKREYEIVVGNTSRAVSAPYYGVDGKYIKGTLSREEYYITVTEGDLVFTGGTEVAILESMAKFLSSFFSYGLSNINSDINLSNGFETRGKATLLEYTGKWSDPKPVANPEIFTDNFDDETADTSPDYWVEAYAKDNWRVRSDGENKVYSADVSAFSYTRLHVYERDIDYTVKMRFDKLTDLSDAGVLARYNDVGAYIRVGYKSGQWYLRYSEGLEYNVYTLDTAPAKIKAGEWYTVRVTVKKNEVKAYVNGVLVLESSYVTHISPGPMGLFAENAAVSFDDVSVTLVSGQGKVMRGVTDSTFWEAEGELCSGSVIELKDGKLRYVHHNELVQQVSEDNGLTWRAEKFTDISTDCVNIFRLQSGNLIKLMEETVNGELYHVSYTSSDEGITWTRGGVVAAHDYMGYGTMIQTIENDKFSQVSSGRLFLSQNYQGSIPSGKPNSHVKVLSEIWYSDDEGKTWTKSQMDSFDCTDAAYIAESKVIETADGALLWITSWNETGYIIASESKDNGVTWGKFYKLTDFTCARSSFGIMRDVYADNNTTYYMTWVYNEPSATVMPRTRLSIAMTTDGRNWKFLGDVYRWENNMTNGLNGSLVSHIVDPFITVTKDYIFVGSGLSARRLDVNNTYHNRQQQKVIRIEKTALIAYDEFPGY